MANLTERAKRGIATILPWVSRGDPEVCLRLTYTDPKHFIMVPDRVKEGDEVIEYQGAKIMLIERYLAGFLKGVTIDYQGTPDGDLFIVWLKENSQVYNFHNLHHNAD